MDNNHTDSGTNTTLLIIILLIIVGAGVWWYTTQYQPKQETGLNIKIGNNQDSN